MSDLTELGLSSYEAAAYLREGWADAAPLDTVD